MGSRGLPKHGWDCSWYVCWMSDTLVRTFVANQKHKERSKIIVSWKLVFFPVNLVLKILLAVAYFEISATAISTF
jgi:hypothetical protein